MSKYKTILDVILKLLANKFIYLVGKQIEDRRWEYTYQQYRRRYEISPTFRFNGPEVLLYGDGRIILQGNSYIGRHSHIQSWSNCEVRIGKNCAISYFVMIYTMNRLPDQDFGKTKNMGKVIKGNVKIGDNCWIGAYVYVNQGVSIGDNAVIGVHSTVNRDIPPHSIAVGTPARVIKFKSYLDEKELLELAKRYWPSLSSTLKHRFIKKYNELTCMHASHQT